MFFHQPTLPDLYLYAVGSEGRAGRAKRPPPPPGQQARGSRALPARPCSATLRPGPGLRATAASGRQEKAPQESLCCSEGLCRAGAQVPRGWCFARFASPRSRTHPWREPRLLPQGPSQHQRSCTWSCAAPGTAAGLMSTIQSRRKEQLCHSSGWTARLNSLEGYFFNYVHIYLYICTMYNTSLLALHCL